MRSLLLLLSKLHFAMSESSQHVVHVALDVVADHEVDGRGRVLLLLLLLWRLLLLLLRHDYAGAHGASDQLVELQRCRCAHDGGCGGRGPGRRGAGVVAVGLAAGSRDRTFGEIDFSSKNHTNLPLKGLLTLVYVGLVQVRGRHRRSAVQGHVSQTVNNHPIDKVDRLKAIKEISCHGK